MTPNTSSNEPAARQRVRLEGVLDMVQANDSSFRLILPDGRVVSGRYAGGGVQGLARVLGRPLLMFGSGRVGPASELTDFEADGFLPNDGKLWAVQPEDFPFSPEVHEELLERQRAARGTWPGDETDEQITQALKELG